MARERLVTRTINVTVANAICMDVVTCEVVHKEFTITGTPDNNTILKILKKEHETETFKVVAIEFTNTIEELYGMKETDFIKLATKMENRFEKI